MDVIGTHRYGEAGGVGENSFNVNKDEGIIVFKHPLKHKLILEYQASGITIDKETTIPLRLFNVIKARVEYILAGRCSLKNTQFFLMELNREMSLLKASEKSFTLDELKDMLAGTYRQTPQR